MVLDMTVRNWCELNSFKTYCKQRQFNGENTVFSTNGAGTSRHLHAKQKNKNLDTYLILFTNNNSNLITGLKVKHRFLEESIRGF